MSTQRGRSPGRSRGRGPAYQNANIRRPDPWLATWLSLAIVLFIVMAGAGLTTRGRIIDLATEHFLVHYAGVFTLISLTASVGIGLAATDRIIMSPSGRVTIQTVHRAAALGAMGFLTVHIVTEIISGHSHPADAVIPFLDHGRRFYLGLGTVASDMFIVVVVTGVLRTRFVATSHVWLWRALHAMVYVSWPLGILHGLLGGRAGKAYVDWSYGALIGVVAIYLTMRFVATTRDDRTIASQPVPERASAPPMWPPQLAAAGAAAQLYGAQPRALPAQPVAIAQPIGQPRPQQRALPAAPSHDAEPRQGMPTVQYERTDESHPYDRGTASQPYDRTAHYGRITPPGPYDRSVSSQPASYEQVPYEQVSYAATDRDDTDPYGWAPQPGRYDEAAPLFAENQTRYFDDGFGNGGPSATYPPARTS